MNRYRICGTVSVDIYAEIDANSLEEAMEYAEDNFRMEEYCNGTVGCEDGNYEFSEAEVTCCCDIDWHEEYSDLVEENVEGYDFDDLENEDEDEEEN